ncbi:MAG: MoxR family ATPase [Steroidobacteraceae bacterium]
MFTSIEDVGERLAEYGYIADRRLSTSVYLADFLEKPLFLEGDPGVGKTELAKAIARSTGGELVRLQCYEGLDARDALYEWNYLGQLLELRMQEARGIDRESIGRNIYDPRFLLERPVLKAIRPGTSFAPVLLIDEIDRADDEFEAFLLEVLSDFQISIPEIGTVRAERRPFVVLTSNRTREVHDALKRRCLYQWIDHPDLTKELRIVTTRVPGIQSLLAEQVCRFMQSLRQEKFFRSPGIAETIDWARALLKLGVSELDPATVSATMGCILKYHGDQKKLDAEMLQKAVAVSKNFKGSSLPIGRPAGPSS